MADALCEEIPVLRKYRCDADYTVDKKGRGHYLHLEDAVAAATLLEALSDKDSAKKEITIQILGGVWTKPQLPKKTNIKFILREGATWK